MQWGKLKVFVVIIALFGFSSLKSFFHTADTGSQSKTVYPVSDVPSSHRQVGAQEGVHPSSVPTKTILHRTGMAGGTRVWRARGAQQEPVYSGDSYNLGKLPRLISSPLAGQEGTSQNRPDLLETPYGAVSFDAYSASRRPVIFAPQVFQHMVIDPLARYSKRVRELFDEVYYRTRYPEAVRMGGPMLEHYMRTGFRQGYSPFPGFDETFYQRSHLFRIPDVPGLLHYSDTGEGEGLVTNASQIQKVEPLSPAKQKYYLAMCAIFRDEAPYLKEWIEYHRLMGVEHFYLFNHRSCDNFEAVLAPYIQKGVVELGHFERETPTYYDWCKLQYGDCYAAAIKKAAEEAEWLAIVDVDEFIVPKEAESLNQLLHNYDDCAALCATWIMFGTSGVQSIPENKLLIETLTKREAFPLGAESFMKSIVKPRYVRESMWAHGAHLYPGYYAVDENRQPFFDRVRTPSASVDSIQINHYWSRDQAFLEHTKLGRVHVRHQKPAEVRYRSNVTFCQEEDQAVLRFVPALRQRVGLDELTPPR